MDTTNNDIKPKRTMPVCLNQDNLKLVEEYAKKNGMLDYSQALEYLVKK
jgi:hypothetical protein